MEEFCCDITLCQLGCCGNVGTSDFLYKIMETYFTLCIGFAYVYKFYYVHIFTLRFSKIFVFEIRKRQSYKISQQNCYDKSKMYYLK